MSFADTPKMRAFIQERLRTYMAGPPPKGEIQVANTINELAPKLYPGSDRRRALISHDTIVRFVKENPRSSAKNISRQKLDVIYRFLVLINFIGDATLGIHSHPMFHLIETFFGVRPHNLARCERLEGTYSLYFRSEDLINRIVVGAVEFGRDTTGTAFEMQERQERKATKAFEQWYGYYFARKDRIIIIARGSDSLENTPKFYILTIPHSDQKRHITEIGGMVLKLGTANSVFSTKVLLRKNNNAFRQCDVKALADIGQDILDEI